LIFLLLCRILNLASYKKEMNVGNLLLNFLAMQLEFARLIYQLPYKSCVLVFNCSSAGLNQLVCHIHTFYLFIYQLKATKHL
jgi:hypothetical protein